MKVSEHFDIREFVPKEIWDKFGEKSIWFVDERIISSMEIIRVHFGKQIWVNNWLTGGTMQSRGFRMPHNEVGSRLSQHKYGRAADFNVRDISSDDVYDNIKENWDHFKTLKGFHFTTMENKQYATSWTHLDMRWTGSNNLLIVNP